MGRPSPEGGNSPTFALGQTSTPHEHQSELEMIGKRIEGRLAMRSDDPSEFWSSWVVGGEPGRELMVSFEFENLGRCRKHSTHLHHRQISKHGQTYQYKDQDQVCRLVQESACRGDGDGVPPPVGGRAPHRVRSVELTCLVSDRPPADTTSGHSSHSLVNMTRFFHRGPLSPASLGA